MTWRSRRVRPGAVAGARADGRPPWHWRQGRALPSRQKNWHSPVLARPKEHLGIEIVGVVLPVEPDDRVANVHRKRPGDHYEPEPLRDPQGQIAQGRPPVVTDLLLDRFEARAAVELLGELHVAELELLELPQLAHGCQHRIRQFDLVDPQCPEALQGLEAEKSLRCHPARPQHQVLEPEAPLPAREAFARGLSEFGYVEGKNIVIEFRATDGIEQLPGLATELVYGTLRVLPFVEKELDDVVAAMKDGIAYAHKHGITSVHDMSGENVFKDHLWAYQTLKERGELNLRVLAYIPDEDLDHAIALGLRSGFGDEWVRIGGIKLFSDGTLGSQTALMLSPFEGAPANTGIAVTPLEVLHDRMSRLGAELLADQAQ